MKRAMPVGLVLAVLVAGVAFWRCRGGNEATTPASGGSAGTAVNLPAASHAPTRGDPRTASRASIAGSVTDETKAPAAHVLVCADFSSRVLPSALQKDPVCASTDDHGAYKLDNLLAATYTVTAGGKPYLPAEFHPDGDRKRSSFTLASGQAKTGVDIAVRHGGVAITGTVSDISGGGIAHAKVRASGSRWGGGTTTPPADTDDAGKFALWVAEGATSLTATADGYADGNATGRAPGSFEILMTPESTLAGIVIDAKTGTPVSGVRVTVAQGEFSWADDEHVDLSDASGAWRVAGLKPGRYVAAGKASDAFGRTEGSVLVGLGQHVEGVIVKVFPAHRIEGKVMIAAAGTEPPHPCLEGRASLQDPEHDRYLSGTADPDGTIHIEGVLPGKYTVRPSCPTLLSHDKYDPIVIADADATGLVWEVGAGATIRGKLVTKSGEPVPDASVWASSVGGAARAKGGWASDTTAHDGAYELTGVKAGAYKLEVSTDKGIAPTEGYKVEVAEGAKLEKDLVLDDGGKITGTVVDETGKPVSDVTIRPRALASQGYSFGSGQSKSDASGNFTVDGLRPGDYRVVAALGWMDDLRKPGSTDDAKQGELVTVKPNAVASVHLVVESRGNAITGVVLDADGKPVSDAYLSSARESDAAGAQRSDVGGTRGWAWSDGDKPVLTATDGTFRLGGLSKGNYTVRAYRKGGGEAVAEHVATGSRTTLQIKPTGSIEGKVHAAAGASSEISVALSDAKTGFSRSESFYMTDGGFSVHDLPAGHFKIIGSASGGQKMIELDLADGETKTGVDIALEQLVDITGRVVDSATRGPVPGMRMIAMSADGGGFAFNNDDENLNITDDTGHFTVKRVAVGKVMVRGIPKDFRDSDYNAVSELHAVAAPTGGTTVDLGDLTAIKKRVKPGGKVGELGIHFAEQAPDTQPDKREYKVSWIDPAGPAAKVDLKIGDTITSIDGNDVTGSNSPKAWPLMRAPPGTSMAFGLARGTTVTIVLASP